MNTRQLSNSTQHGVNFIYAICSEEGETSGRLGRLAGVDSVSKISPEDIWIMRASSGGKIWGHVRFAELGQRLHHFVTASPWAGV